MISELQLYDLLSEKLGREQAKALTEYVETKAEKHLNENAGFLHQRRYSQT